MVIEIAYRDHWTSTNYYHFLTQWVCRLYQLLEDAGRLAAMDVPIYYDGPYIELVQCFTREPVRRGVPSGPDVVRLTWEGVLPPRNPYLRPVALLICDRLGLTSACGAFITVIVRERCRRIAGRDELLNQLTTTGLAVREVDFAALTLREQVAYARESHVLVGALGAGLTNVLFMRPGSLLFELMPFAFAIRTSAELAQVMGVTYQHLEAGAAFPKLVPQRLRSILRPDARAKIISNLWTNSELRCLVRDVPEVRVDHATVASAVTKFLAGEAPTHAVAPGQRRRIAVLTLYDDPMRELAEVSVANKRRYCQHHGYDFIVFPGTLDPTRPTAWSKIKLVQRHLADYDWVFWSDIDSLFMNDDVRLEEFVNPAFDLVLTADSNGTSTGQFLIHNNAHSREFLARVYREEKFINHFWWEQAAVQHLFNTRQAGIEAQVLPQRTFNSYPDCFTAGDFVVHFAGRDDRLEGMRWFSSLPMEMLRRLSGRKLKLPSSWSILENGSTQIQHHRGKAERIRSRVR